MTGAADPVVVGVDRSSRSMLAVDWAAAQAALRGVPLVLAHASHVGRGGDEGPVLDAAEERAAAAGRPLEVRRVSRPGDACELLAGLSRGAGLVAVGAPEPLGPDPVLGSVGPRLAAVASAPVAVVRGDASSPPPDRPVVAAVSGPQRLTAFDPVLELAFEVGRREGRPVVAVHACGTAGQRARAAADLGSDLAALAAAGPAVRARLEVPVDAPDRALVERSEHAALLVLGVRRLRSGTWWDRVPVAAPLLARVGPLLGFSALEEVLAWRSRCPVVLVPSPCPAAAA